MYIKKHEEEFIVLDPDWLGSDVLGTLLSQDSIKRLSQDGKVTTDDLRRIIPATSPADLIRLLSTLNLCAPVRAGVDGDVIMSCLDRSEEQPAVKVNRTADKVHFTNLRNKIK